jgi:hypothetical protein
LKSVGASRTPGVRSFPYGHPSISITDDTATIVCSPEVATREVRIKNVVLEVTADHTAGAMDFLRRAEQALPRALDGLADALGDEVLVIRRLRLAFGASIDGSTATLHQVEAALRQELERRVDEARRGGMGSEAAWYASEAAAVAAYLSALAQGRQREWPHRAWARLGATWDAVLESCSTKGTTFTGDVLAEVARLAASKDLFRLVGAGVASKLVELWLTRQEQSGVPSAGLCDWFGLPRDVRHEVLERALADSTGAWRGSDLAARSLLVLLAALFERWPPARALRFPLEQVQSEWEQARRAEGPSSRERAPKLESSAGGLVFWATLWNASELESELAASYTEERVRRAVRWAIGRALESGSASQRDPLLMLWAGEPPDALGAFSQVLIHEDPELLHRLALRRMTRAPDFAAHLKLAPLGDGVVAIGPRGCVVDFVAGATVHGAVPRIVQRFRERAGRDPESLDVADRLESADIDAVTEVDVPSLPEHWRTAARACGSLLRFIAEAAWRTSMRSTRGWAATLGGDEVELRRADVTSIGGGSWLGETMTIRIGGHERAVVLR